MRSKFNYILTCLCLLIWLAFGLHKGEAAAADIRPYINGTGAYRAVLIEGKIEAGDYETFLKIIQENQAQINGVYLFTPGGDFVEAMKIGRALRALELSSQVPMKDSNGRPVCDDTFGPKPNDPKYCTCASAGFFIHIGGVHRGGTYLAAHRPYFGKGKFGELSKDDAKKAFDVLQDQARDYMQEMGVPKHIQEDILGTPSDKALLLDEKTVKTHFWMALPYRHEWMKNRCSVLTTLENDQMESYSKRLSVARNASDTTLSQHEWSDFYVLQEKQKQESDCSINVSKRNRVEAYEKFFKIKPNDSAGHNFNKWIDAAGYLGKRYYEILAEEKFDEDTSMGGTNLLRPATGTAPAIVLGDFGRPKVVTWVNIISPPNPSLDYIKSVLNVLTKTWGQQSDGDGESTWLWSKRNFKAKLKKNPVSGSGAFLSLVIETN